LLALRGRKYTCTFTRSNNEFLAALSQTPWGTTIGWNAYTPIAPTSTLIALSNGDGTFTHVIGTGFALNGSYNATGGFVTSVQHCDDTNTGAQPPDQADRGRFPFVKRRSGGCERHDWVYNAEGFCSGPAT
jgi:hypothetical protein